MPSVVVLNQMGEEINKVELNDNVFGIEPNRQAIYEVVNAERAAMRQGTHKTKKRKEVKGGGRKPWRQRARAVRAKARSGRRNGRAAAWYLVRFRAVTA